jgi:hypothetical protein
MSGNAHTRNRRLSEPGIRTRDRTTFPTRPRLMPRVARQYAEQWLETEVRYGGDAEPVEPYRSPKSHCEQCARETEFLFDGFVTSKATQYGFKGKSKRPQTIGMVDVERPGKVCQRCRPLSNLEIIEEAATLRQQLKGEPCPTNTKRSASSSKNTRPASQSDQEEKSTKRSSRRRAS